MFILPAKLSANGDNYFATMLLFYIFGDFMKYRINWDAWGIAASMACAIHCALLPLFLTTLPLFGINIIHNTVFEAGMIGLALYHGHKKHHHNRLPLFIFFAGFVFLVLKQFFVEYETWLLIPAVTLIISAHLLNFRYCRVHNHAHADDCDH
jgi:hypothetical protein